MKSNSGWSMDNHYDVIIAGAGAAGAIIASRLTEDADRSVLVLDAGPDFPNLESLPEEIRYAYGRDRNLWDRAFGAGTMFGWGYRARATDHAPNIFVPRGKIVGGSSAVNAQIFLRGMPEDYDSWAQAGSDGWSHQDLLPFFCMNETDLDYGDKAYHGDAGPIRARRFKHAELNTEHRAFYAAARDAGYADCPDHNAPDTTGVGPLPLNNAEGIRWSTAIGYLNPARSRPNLTIQANTHVCRVLFDGKKATGLQVEQNGTPGEVHGGEILLCGGSIGSPHVLLLSGVGPAAHLEEMGVPTVCDLPGVGQNLREHPQIGVTLRAKEQYLTEGTEPRLQMGLRYTATGSSLRNDMLIIPASFATEEGYYTTAHSKPLGFYLVGSLYLAASAGDLTLASIDPHQQPILNYNYLDDPFDAQRLRESIRIIIDLLEHEGLKELVAERLAPTDAQLTTDAALDEWIRTNVTTSHHVSSTCKMGTDPLAVVDGYGKVHGLENLRVADAAIMPDCVRANTNITSMVIGERIADFMRRGH
ncbi:MAG: GMC family oxidoreductase N-terminal domain-containing protein [Candidatus Latescibacteria bacterium]|jgi:choline dehydrogenase|nr:GMC family oxidoreductase N-terminal domain-containing protein [Candidatus Latescibacterota bacterium]